MTSASERPTFLLRLRPEKGIDPIRALHRILKFALRGRGMRATAVVEERSLAAANAVLDSAVNEEGAG